MKKEVIALFLLGTLLVSPLVFAQVEEQTQEQVQTYSGFSRFIDNIKLFFSSGDNKVNLALEIREKEVNSAMNHIQNNNEDKAIKNLERARKKLQIIQEKVSVEIAEEVQENSQKILNKINNSEISLDEFELYKLEEEKTQITAELVVEVEGKQGQTLTREIVIDKDTGEKKVIMTVEGEPGEKNKVIEGGVEGQSQEQIRTREIETKMNQIDGEINNWKVEHTYAEGTGPGGDSESNIVDNVVAGDGKVSDVGNSIDKGDPGKNEVVGNDGPAPGDTDVEEGWVEKNEIYEGTGGEGSEVDP